MRAICSVCHGCFIKLAVACFSFEKIGRYACPSCVSIMKAEKGLTAVLLKVSSNRDTDTLVQKIGGTCMLHFHHTYDCMSHSFFLQQRP